MKPQTKHTPTPWILSSGTNGAVRAVHAWKEGGKHIIIAKFPDRTIEDSAEMEANAAFIVRACNAHEELLKLIKTAYCIVAEAMPKQAPDPVAFVSVQKDWLKRTEQAIAKAEGQL